VCTGTPVNYEQTVRERVVRPTRVFVAKLASTFSGVSVRSCTFHQGRTLVNCRAQLISPLPFGGTL